MDVAEEKNGRPRNTGGRRWEKCNTFRSNMGASRTDRWGASSVASVARSVGSSYTIPCTKKPLDAQLRPAKAQLTHSSRTSTGRWLFYAENSCAPNQWRPQDLTKRVHHTLTSPALFPFHCTETQLAVLPLPPSLITGCHCLCFSTTRPAHRCSTCGLGDHGQLQLGLLCVLDVFLASRVSGWLCAGQ